MSDNVEVINPQGPGSTVAPNSSATAQQAKTAADANAKAQGQSSKCSNGGCGTQVPGQCCEWMSKFNIAMQRAMRPYSNSCGSCGGSGDKGGGACQACDGTGIEGSTGGGNNVSAFLIKLKWIGSEIDMADVYTWFGYSDKIPELYKQFSSATLSPLAERYSVDHLEAVNDSYAVAGYYSMLDFTNRFATTFSSDWKGNYIISLVPASQSIDISILSTLPKTYSNIIYAKYPKYFRKSSEFITVYTLNGIAYALQSDLREEFPEGNF